MKLLFIPIAMSVAGLFGYMAEPSLRFQLTGKNPSPTKVAAKETLMLQLPDGKQIELSSVAADQLPKVISLNKDFDFKDTASGIAVSIASGSEVNLLRIDGINAVVSKDQSGFEVKIPVKQTDLLQKIAATLLQKPATEKPALTAAPESPAEPEMVDATPDPEPEPVISPAETAPEPELVATPEPTVKPEPMETVQDTGATGVVKVMQDSIRSGQVKEFKYDAVTEWRAGPDETIGGQTYQIGLLLYKAETILGTRSLPAKALIKSDRVTRWVKPKSGVEIK